MSLSTTIPLRGCPLLLRLVLSHLNKREKCLDAFQTASWLGELKNKQCSVRFVQTFHHKRKLSVINYQLLLEEDLISTHATKQAISELPCACFKTSLRAIPWHEFHLHGNVPVGETHFRLTGFARRLVSTQRQRQLGRVLLVCKTRNTFSSNQK